MTTWKEGTGSAMAAWSSAIFPKARYMPPPVKILNLHEIVMIVRLEGLSGPAYLRKLDDRKLTLRSATVH